MLILLFMLDLSFVGSPMGFLVPPKSRLLWTERIKNVFFGKNPDCFFFNFQSPKKLGVVSGPTPSEQAILTSSPESDTSHLARGMLGCSRLEMVCFVVVLRAIFVCF